MLSPEALQSLLKLIDAMDLYTYKGKLIQALELGDLDKALGYCRQALEMAHGFADPGASVISRDMHIRNAKYLRTLETRIMEAMPDPPPRNPT